MSLKSFFVYHVIVIFLVILECRKTEAHWWSLANRASLDTLLLGSRPLCEQMDTLSRNQKALCLKYSTHMQYVSKGAQDGIEECKHQFRHQRWNCSTVEDNSVFGKVVKIGSRETAFTYAISAAGVVVAVARACKNEQLQGHCGCSGALRPDGLDRDWKWGGCGDDTEYAYGFAREFIDARERDNLASKKVKDKARKEMNKHNNEAGRMTVAQDKNTTIHGLPPSPTEMKLEVATVPIPTLAIAVRSARPTCKCHGVSGSCSLKTCWMQIPSFREIGNELMTQYKRALEVRGNQRGALRPRRPSEAPVLRTSLVYLDSSPDYCISNRKTGVKGTRGRECVKDALGPEGCGLMCCGRGYRTFRVRVVEKCNCKFQWCCSVQCEWCERTVKRHICN